MRNLNENLDEYIKRMYKILGRVEDYQIEMLNVEDADAFVIYYRDLNGDDKLVLVDCGRYDDGEKVLEHLEMYYPEKTVDLAIVTHCDDDHFGGFIYLLEQELEENFYGIEKFLINVPDDEYMPNNRYSELVELIDDMEIEREPAFSDEFCPFTVDFPNFKILGPTKKFYEEQSKEFKKNDALKESSSNFSKSEVDSFEDDNRARNASSIIFCFVPNPDEKFLFMGDANENAWENIEERIKTKWAKDIFWLKLPHHGSEHNLSGCMIEFIKPKIAYVSTKKIGKWLSMKIVDDLTAIGCEVYSTHKCEGSIFFENGISTDENNSLVEPIN